MIEIGKILFRFTANNESFAHRLYAGWDEFCRNCFENVVEEYLSVSDNENHLIEINSLTLNLGNIPEESFYQLFPIRLREQLERCLSLHFKIEEKKYLSKNKQYNLSDLLYYLEHGFCKTASAYVEFNLNRKLTSIIDDDENAIADLFQKGIENRTILERLLLQSDKTIFSTIVSIWFDTNSIDINEKRRQLFWLAVKYPSLLWQIIDKIWENESIVSQFIDTLGIRLLYEMAITLPPSLSDTFQQLNSRYPEMLFRKTDALGVHLDWLFSDSFVTLSEKKQHWLSLLDIMPQDIIEIISNINDQQLLKILAEVMDDIAISKIISEFGRQKGGIEISVYWLQFCEWLIEHYSTVGFSFCKNKQIFQEQLNMIFLHTLQERNRKVLSSKERLTRCILQSLNKEESKKTEPLILNYLESKHPEINSFENELYDILRNVAISINKQNIPDNENDSRRNIPTEYSEEKSLQTTFIHQSEDNSLASDIMQNESVPRSKPDLQDNRDIHDRNIHLKGTDRQTDLSFQTQKELQSDINNSINNTFQPQSDFDLHTEKSKYVAFLSEEGFQSWVEDKNISTETKINRLNDFAFANPKLFYHFLGSIDYNSATFSHLAGIVPEKMQLQWLAQLSASKAGLLQRTIEMLTEKYQSEIKILIPDTDTSTTLRKALLTLLHEKSKDPKNFYWEDDAKTIESFIKNIYQMDKKENIHSDEARVSKESGKQKAKEALQKLFTEHPEQANEETNIEYLSISNAGLALLTPWFPRLFDMLGLMNEEKKDLKDTDARIRAIFIIQQLVTSEDKEYEEHELAFNRMLTGCPFSVPLPRRMELTEQETATIESMLNGVKANWQKIKNTSIQGFQEAFIQRDGELEQQEDKWLLTVEPRAYDMLLDSVPWSYKLIRLPWLKKHIHVSWRD
ncbi:MAG: contractile injection system tape measure protein [Dysgonomonas sp.]|nr:contractile injection system tape measure protein [Dysgonomonas sp.]